MATQKKAWLFCRFPTLSLHGIEGAFSEPGAKTVIPRKVIGKFSIRIVPHQTPDEVEQIVKNYLNKQWALRGSKNAFNVSMLHGGRAWVTDPDSKNFEAGKAATRMAYGVDPDLTREGGSIPVTLTLQEATQKASHAHKAQQVPFQILLKREVKLFI